MQILCNPLPTTGHWSHTDRASQHMDTRRARTGPVRSPLSQAAAATDSCGHGFGLPFKPTSTLGHALHMADRPWHLRTGDQMPQAVLRCAICMC